MHLRPVRMMHHVVYLTSVQTGNLTHLPMTTFCVGSPQLRSLSQVEFYSVAMMTGHAMFGIRLRESVSVYLPGMKTGLVALVSVVMGWPFALEVGIVH